QLLRALFRLIDHRRRITRYDFGTVNFPFHLARVLVDREQIGPEVLIDRDDDFVVNQYRRRAIAVKYIERSQRHSPFLLAVGVECDQPEILKEGIDVFAIGHRAGGRRAVGILQPSLVSARDFTPPKLLARLAVERDDEELVDGLVLCVNRRVRRDVNTRAREYRRGMTW